MRESGYSEELIYDFDGMIAELMMYVEAKMNERIEQTAPERPKTNTIQVPKYGSVGQLFDEIEANVEDRTMLGREAIATLANQAQMDQVAAEILGGLPVKF